MKTKLLLFTMFIGASMFAQLGNVVFFTENGEPFFLTVNGIKINEKAQANVRVEGASEPGFHAVIAFENTALGSFGKDAMVTAGQENTYKVKNSKGVWKAVQFTTAPISAGTVVNNNNTNTIYDQTPVVIDPVQTVPATTSATATVPTTTVTTTQSTANPATVGVSINTSTTTTTSVGSSSKISTQSNPAGIGISLNVNINDPNPSSTSTSQKVEINMAVDTMKLAPGIIYHTEPGIQNPPINSGVESTSTSTTKPDNSMAMSTGCSSPMETSDFASAKSSIAAESFSDTKMMITKQVLNNNCVSTSQVKELMVLFASDEDRLELAKYAYDYTTDKKNYYKVNDAFVFSSSKDELGAYLKTK